MALTPTARQQAVIEHTVEDLIHLKERREWTAYTLVAHMYDNREHIV